jgi:tetratricopeptide (TPR) repeat protein
VALYREAIAKAPDDARAWAGLARAYNGQASQGYADTLEGYRNARQAVDRALAIDDTLPEAYENLGFILAAFEFRWEEAVQALRKANALAPGNGRILATLAITEAVRGRIDEALRLSEPAIGLDPLSAVTHVLRARILSWARRDEESIAGYRKALELSPGITTAHAAIGILLAAQGRTKEAVAEAAKERSIGYRSWALAIANHALGDGKASDEALAALIGQGEDWSYQIAAVYGARGDADHAFEWLERAFFLRDSGLPLLRLTRHFDGLHSDPRWPRFLARVGMGS